MSAPGFSLGQPIPEASHSQYPIRDEKSKPRCSSHIRQRRSTSAHSLRARRRRLRSKNFSLSHLLRKSLLLRDRPSAGESSFPSVTPPAVKGGG